MTPETAFAEAMKFDNRANPYPFFDELRKTPVARVANGTYVVTGYREVIALAHDPRVSSDLRKRPRATAAGNKKSSPPPAGEAERLEADTKAPSMIASDPPDHDRARRMAMRHFGPPHTPALIPSMEGECHRIVTRLLDKARGKTRIDVVDDYAYPLPVTVICKVMGVPLADEPRIHTWIEEMMNGMDLGPEAASPEQQRRQAKGQESRQELTRYLVDLVDRYAKEPGDGMISEMLHDNAERWRSPGELVSNTALLLIAGHDSTVNLISHCVLTALRNPGTIERLRSRPELVPGAIEETLRLQSSVQFFPTRSALADIEIAGTVIPKGAPILLMYGAANRDPNRFPNPNEFDVEREDREHLGWGSGIHTCFGGPLARLEVNTAFDAFIRRAVNPRLVVDPPPYRRNQVFRGPRHLLIDVDGIRD